MSYDVPSCWQHRKGIIVRVRPPHRPGVQALDRIVSRHDTIVSCAVPCLQRLEEDMLRLDDVAAKAAERMDFSAAVKARCVTLDVLQGNIALHTRVCGGGE